MIDTQRLAEILVEYKKNFVDTGWKEEKYKWEAIKTFQDNWDINAEDFPEMLDKSLSKTANLLSSSYYFPRSMIRKYAQAEPDEVRAMFKALYDESRDVVERITEFKQRTAVIHDLHTELGQNAYQDDTSISTYLWLRYPDKYYIYKSTELKNVANELHLDYKFITGKKRSEENFRHFYPFYDEICEYLKTDDELTDLLKSHLSEECYSDPEYRTLTVDIAYYIGKNYKAVDNKKTDVKLYVDGYPKGAAGEDQTGRNILQDAAQEQYGERRYWWLNASPKIWRFSDVPVGEKQFYTLYNDNGNKRRIFQNFLDVRAGDIVIGYETNPVKQIVAICEITAGQDGKNIWFKKTESLISPIDYATLKEIPELAGMEFFVNKNGSLFKLTQNEYDTILDLIREENPLPEEEKQLEKYSKEKFLEDVFMDEKRYDRLVAVLKSKKNIILQGAPGVGKTFAAKRLAYSIIGEKDENRVQFIQFHQNYSYEDFMMGYRPSGEGFRLEHGIFYDFCRTASNSPDKDYFFIIDEINRGNMSKIFGELLMLIEADKRGEKIKLASSGELFSVPKNLYIIGMMNTADRSLAMIDYALRRRFSFFTMDPAFDSEGFLKYQKELDNERFDKLIDKVKELNKVITDDKSLGLGFRIGHSYFSNWKKEECTDEKIEQVVEFDILPMLEEYWFDETSKYDDWVGKFRSILE